jgi:Skp family chaperone for outer membrane proteins
MSEELATLTPTELHEISTIKSDYFALIAPVTAPAISHTIHDPAAYHDADSILASIQTTKKSVESRLEEKILPIRTRINAWHGLRRELVDELELAERTIKSKMAAYKTEEMRQEQERARLEQEETRKRAREAEEASKQAQQAGSAIERARAKLRAQQIVNAPMTVPPPPPPVRASRSSSIPTQTWRIVDRAAFLKGIVDGTIPTEMVEIHSVNMNAMWKINKGKVAGWPGVGVEDGVSIRGRG